MHLKTISHLLLDIRVSQTQSSMSVPNKEQEEPNEDLRAKFDEELRVVQPFIHVEDTLTTLPLSTSYMDWLRLMLAHFNAVNILIKHITRPEFPYNSISSLLWWELFTNSTLFPTETALSVKASISNANILEFLTNAMASSSLAKTAIKKWRNRNRELDKLKEDLKKLSFSNVLSWRNHATKLLGKIESGEEVSEDLLISL